MYENYLRLLPRFSREFFQCDNGATEAKLSSTENLSTNF